MHYFVRKFMKSDFIENNLIGLLIFGRFFFQKVPALESNLWFLCEIINCSYPLQFPQLLRFLMIDIQDQWFLNCVPLAVVKLRRDVTVIQVWYHSSIQIYLKSNRTTSNQCKLPDHMAILNRNPLNQQFFSIDLKIIWNWNL